MKKPKEMIGYEGHLIDPNVISPKQLKEAHRLMIANIERDKKALKAANKVLTPSRLSKWTRRAIMVSMIAPVTPVAGCIINHYYGKPVTLEMLDGRPKPPPEPENLEPIFESKDSPVKSWYESTPEEERMGEIIGYFIENIEEIMGEPPELDTWKEFEFEYKGEKFNGRLMTHVENGVAYMPVEIKHGDDIIFRYVFNDKDDEAESDNHTL